MGLVVLQSCASQSPSTNVEPSPSPVASAGPASNSPQLDWPPPKPSASTTVPSASLRKPQGKVTYLRDVDQKLGDALVSNGYARTSYFAVPNGFAIVTQLEHINADGTSRGADRWRTGGGNETSGKFSLTNYLKALFTASPGYYRVIIFVVTSQPFAKSEEPLSSEKAEAWLSKGLDKLPEPIANLKFTEEYRATALIYEFRKSESEKSAVFSYPSKWDGKTHLKGAKLWDNLVK